jgi:hypothetical protein
MTPGFRTRTTAKKRALIGASNNRGLTRKQGLKLFINLGCQGLNKDVKVERKRGWVTQLLINQDQCKEIIKKTAGRSLVRGAKRKSIIWKMSSNYKGIKISGIEPSDTGPCKS